MQSSRGSDPGEEQDSGPGGSAREPQGGAGHGYPARGADAEGQPVGDSAPVDLSDELARIEDRYKRALADLDNYRKRATREVDRRVAEARESALNDWLQVVDSVERAIQLEPEGPCYEGLRAV